MGGMKLTKTREKHPQGDDSGTSKRIPCTTIYIATLESDKRRENDKWSGEHVSDGDTVDKHLLREPLAKKHCFRLDEGNGRVRTPKGQATRYQTENKEVDEVRLFRDAERKGHRRWDTPVHHIESVTNITGGRKEQTNR